MSVPNIYACDDYRAFLKGWFEERKGKVSMNSFAAKVGCSRQYVSAVIKADRDLDTTRVPSWSRALGLDDDEAHYFAALVDLELPSKVRREAARGAVRAMQRFQSSQRIGDDRLMALYPWYNAAIVELARCAGFRADPEWIAGHLTGVTPEQAARAVEDLLRVGVLRRSDDGEVRAVGDLVTPQNVQRGELAEAVRELHLSVFERAAQALVSVPSAERRFSAVTLAVPEDRLPELLRRMEELERDLLAFCAGLEGDRTRVFQLAMQLLPVSAPTRDVTPP